ncbi:Serine/threonine-protein kinase PAK 5 [Podospora pseudocomata]|uniref:Serine/threonine-protein kinase PAK 5 n=1 Tax=Podospora pseudocomata TaxID=2093779 RepID=A0ABR0GHH7_9PEZI|nr:Serine/threonine-protein kinase PAK 5 [Podospora pseudocomata]
MGKPTQAKYRSPYAPNCNAISRGCVCAGLSLPPYTLQELIGKGLIRESLQSSRLDFHQREQAGSDQNHQHPPRRSEHEPASLRWDLWRKVQRCDFGVAGLVKERADKRKTVTGTLRWMAPELFDKTVEYGKVHRGTGTSLGLKQPALPVFCRVLSRASKSERPREETESRCFPLPVQKPFLAV